LNRVSKTLAIGIAGWCSASAAFAQLTERVSVDSSEIEANYGSELPSPTGAIVSSDGRFVAFQSSATNLVPGDTNGTWDVFVRDRLTGTTERVSIDSSGVQANGSSGLYGISISPDGRYVVFESIATNLVIGDTNGAGDLFLRDRLMGTTERVSLDSSGAQGNALSTHPSIADAGRLVVLASNASNLVAGDTNGELDIFIRDRVSGATELVSVSTAGVQGNSISEFSSISADGRYVAFSSSATNLAPLDTNLRVDVFVRDRQLGLTTRVSRSSTGVQGNGHSNLPCISSDGRYVAFMSEATNLVAGDTNARTDVFVHDRLTAATVRVSLGPGGIQADDESTEPSFSGDARFLAFQSRASNLVANVPFNLTRRIYVRDLLAGTNELVSVATDGSQSGTTGAMTAWISSDGRYVTFKSSSTDLVPGDMNGAQDVFIHDRHASGFSSLCTPGQDGVIDCPCGNPPSAAGRGCENSSSTGGAALSASGIAYLSIDSLVFTTRFEKPTATSILLQGDAPLPSGAGFGQGVRCVGGTMKRLYVKLAANGSITAPELGAGEPTISARSATLGAPILPGETRYYLVYYRDPFVLGGCPAGSTFNSTQTGSATWWP
jgi:Tol biopolymer transport system component